MRSPSNLIPTLVPRSFFTARSIAITLSGIAVGMLGFASSATHHHHHHTPDDSSGGGSGGGTLPHYSTSAQYLFGGFGHSGGQYNRQYGDSHGQYSDMGYGDGYVRHGGVGGRYMEEEAGGEGGGGGVYIPVGIAHLSELTSFVLLASSIAAVCYALASYMWRRWGCCELVVHMLPRIHAFLSRTVIHVYCVSLKFRCVWWHLCAALRTFRRSGVQAPRKF